MLGEGLRPPLTRGSVVGHDRRRAADAVPADMDAVVLIPGFHEGIINSDLPVIQGTVLFGAFFIVMANLVVDVLYAFVDPKVSYS